MRLFPLRFDKKREFNFVKYARHAIIFSITAIIFSVILLFTKGLNKGIDFTGGIIIEARYNEVPDLANIRKSLSENIKGDISLQNFGSKKDIIIRVGQDSNEKEEQVEKITQIKELLSTLDKDVTYRRVDYVGPTIGNELVKTGIFSLFIAFAAMLIYIWIRFSYLFGVGALAALIHDAILTLGFFSITGLEFNLTSIAAILTIIGYSINDSVVIYDRIRENLRKYRSKKIGEILDMSINQNLSRTILTSMTTVFALIALILFGGPVLKSFSLSVLFGIVVGTYSSVYIAAPFVNKEKLKKKI